MSDWTERTAAVLGVSEHPERQDFDAAEEKCTQYIEAGGDEKAGALLIRAHIRALVGRTDEAGADHRAAMEILGGEPDGCGMLDIASDAMNCSLEPEYCAGLFSDAERLLEKEDAPLKTVAIAYNKQGICLYRAGVRPDEEDACYFTADRLMQRYAAENEKLSEDEKLLSGLIKSNLAECLVREEDYVSAEAYYKASVELFESGRRKSATSADQFAMSLRSLSDIYRMQGRNDESAECLKRALKGLSEHPDGREPNVTSLEASCHNALGTLYYACGDYAAEVEECSAAIELRRNLPPDRLGSATVYSNRAEAYEQLGKYRLAADDYRAAIAELEQADTDSPLVHASIGTRSFALGRALNDAGDLEGALAAFTRSAEYLRDLRGVETDDYTPEQLIEMESLSRFRLSQTACEEKHHNYHLAMTELRRAISLSEQLEQTPDVILRQAVMHDAMGELFELFDEQESAAAEYDAVARLREMLADEIADGGADDDEDGDGEYGVWPDIPDDLPQA